MELKAIVAKVLFFIPQTQYYAGASSNPNLLDERGKQTKNIEVKVKG
jgi:hypothetical protein